MKLISDIINELIDTEKSISAPLLKTKVLASRTHNAELLDWVSNELEGYSLKDTLPKYRIYRCQVIGTFTVGYTQYNDQQIPTAGLPESLEDSIRSVEFYQSISGLENLYKSSTSGVLEMALPAELTGIIGNNWQKMGNPYLHLINARKKVAAAAVNEVISVVRNRLLDFMLKIDEEYGNITDITDLKTKKEEINTIMSQTIINTSGDGNVVNTGDKAKIDAKIKITKGNKEELIKHLEEIGLTSEDTAELAEIIDTEEPNQEKKTFGSKVNAWTTKMLGKALDGSWNVGIGAAGSLLAEAIGKYYGF
jgi:AbiTii